VKIDAQFLEETSVTSLADVASQAEEVGLDGVWFSEVNYDPFIGAAVASTTTARVNLGTGIALAFPRSPMTTAYTSWGLHTLSKGRFILGIGSQVKAHIERRFSAKWESPAPKMREYIQSLRTIWDAWQNKKRLRFEGKFYNFSLMTPLFAPAPVPYPPIPIYMAAVNPIMCQVAGQVADGVLVHPLHSVKYIQERILPAVHAGAAKGGRKPEDVKVACQVLVAGARNQEELREKKEVVRQRVAFYATTPSYVPVLEVHGWKDLQERLNKKFAEGDLAGMTREVSDEMLDTYAVVGTYDEIPHKLKQKYEGLVERVMLTIRFDTDKEAKTFGKSLVSVLKG
jgi:probable F420-dependent oxidoreductase